MVNLKFGAFIFTLCLLLKSCVCETTNPCTIQDTIATCDSNENFKSLPNVAHITKLIVRSKELKRIEKDDLAAFVNLEEIDLSNSGLEEIDENAFATLTKLHKINLAGNTKLKVPNDANFITSNTLTCLNLSNTVVEQLDKTFTHLPQLEILDLSGTNVKDFSPLKIQDKLTKLVVSKSSETKDLCSILSIKEIIEKDANEVATPLDCKPGKDDATKDNKDEGKKQTTLPPKSDEALTTEKKTDVTTEKTTQVTTEKTKEVTTEKKAEVTTEKKAEVTTEKKAEVTTEKKAEVTTEKKTEVTTKASNPPETATTAPKNEDPLVNKADKETTTISAVSTKDKNEHSTPENEHKSSDKETSTVAAVTKDDKNKPEENTTVSSASTENVKVETTEKPKINNEGDINRKSENREKIAVNEEKNKYVADVNPSVVIESSDDTLPSTANTSQSNGVNIVLGIILCVMIVGAIGFGYKYWKNRRSGYTHANTQDNDDDDKELQTIVAHRTDPDQN